MSWTTVNAGALEPGETYRLRLSVDAPYNALTTGALKTAFLARLAVQPVDRISFDHAPPLWDAHRGNFGPFTYLVTFHVRNDVPLASGLDPRALIAVASLVVVSALSFALVSHKLERLVTVVGDTVQDTLAPILSPGTVILAVLALFLFLKARH